MFKIGDFSKLTMISIRMLRHYDSLGLLVPEQTDPDTGYRYYSAPQLVRANRIQSLKNMGFSLSAIGNILAEYGQPESLKKYLTLHAARMREESETIQKQIQMLQSTIERLGKDDYFMDYNVTIKEYPEMNMICLRDTIPVYDEEGRLWQRLHEEMEKQKIQPAANCYSMAVFHDEGYKETDVDVEIRLAVTEMGTDCNGVSFRTIAPVKCATVIVRGDYSHMSAACAAVGNWVSDNGLTFCGPMFNIYHVSPGMDQNPENWVTEVCFPVK